jgi:uncharacterized protein
MLYAVVFEDNPNADPEIRRQHMAAHLDNAARIKAAGPSLNPSNDPAGGLWLVEAHSPGAVEALIKEDPFWPTGLRGAIRILAWSRVFADGSRLI